MGIKWSRNLIEYKICGVGGSFVDWAALFGTVFYDWVFKNIDDSVYKNKTRSFVETHGFSAYKKQQILITKALHQY